MLKSNDYRLLSQASQEIAIRLLAKMLRFSSLATGESSPTLKLDSMVNAAIDAHSKV